MATSTNPTQAMLAASAMADLEPAFTGMPFFTKMTTSILIETLPPRKWDAWTKEKLSASENGHYWRAVFADASDPAPAPAPVPAPAPAPAPELVTEEVDHPAVL